MSVVVAFRGNRNCGTQIEECFVALLGEDDCRMRVCSYLVRVGVSWYILVEHALYTACISRHSSHWCNALHCLSRVKICVNFRHFYPLSKKIIY